MDKEKKEWVVKGISATPEWWEEVERTAEELGISSRSNFIRMAVDNYLKPSEVDSRPLPSPATAAT